MTKTLHTIKEDTIEQMAKRSDTGIVIERREDPYDAIIEDMWEVHQELAALKDKKEEIKSLMKAKLLEQNELQKKLYSICLDIYEKKKAANKDCKSS